MARGRVKYPAIPRGDDKKAVQAMAQVLETVIGATGDKLDKAVTYRDLQELDIVKIGLTLNGQSVSSNVVTTPSPVNTQTQTPTAPTAMTAFISYSTVVITWDVPVYRGHAFTEVWRSTTDSFGTATLVGTSDIAIYSDPLGAADAYYYWVRHVNINSIAGALHDTAGTLAAEPPLGVVIASPVLDFGVGEGGRMTLNAGSYSIRMNPSSSVPLWFGATADLASASTSNHRFAFDTTGGIHAKGITITDTSNNILLDSDGFNGTYIKDLSVESLAIGDNAVSVQSFSDVSAVTIAANATGALASAFHAHDGTDSGAGVSGSALVAVTFEVLRTSTGGSNDTIDLTVEVYDDDDSPGTPINSYTLNVGQPDDANQTYIVPFQLFIDNDPADTFRIEMKGTSKGESFTLSAKVVVSSAKR